VQNYKKSTGFLKDSKKEELGRRSIFFYHTGHPTIHYYSFARHPGSIFSTKLWQTEIIQLFSVATTQRLGYILDCVLNEDQLANRLWKVSRDLNQKFYRQPLSTGKKTAGHKTDPKWRIIINTEIEIDE